jgi:prepilin-type N-terminal cleavage/methylation domain-containing protein
MSLPSRLRRRGFTLLELMLVITLIAVLVLMSWRTYGYFVKKADSVACVKKMTNFGVALANYVSDKHTWPDEDILKDGNGNPPTEARLWDWWYEEMKEYGIGKDDWFCPAELRRNSHNSKSNDDDDDEAGNKRQIQDPSYIPAKFSYGAYKPFEYGQPWLIERADFHDTGANKLMPDGSVQKEMSLENLRKMKGGGDRSK